MRSVVMLFVSSIALAAAAQDGPSPDKANEAPTTEGSASPADSDATEPPSAGSNAEGGSAGVGDAKTQPEPTSSEPTSSEPTSSEPTSSEPTSSEQAPSEPTSSEQAPSEQAPPEQAPPEIRVITVSRKGMGTRLQIMLYPRNGDRDGAKVAIEAAFTEMERIEGMMSEWLKDSEVSRINRAAGTSEGIPVSIETFEVLSRGREISLGTEGSFSMTWAALSSLWDFGQAAAERKRVPEPSKALQRTALVDDKQLMLDSDDKTARLSKSGMSLGLGGIAKGYAIDRAISILRERGYPDALVFAGGDIAVSGTKGDKPWLVGVQDPRSVGYFATLPLENEAVVSSGDYERFFDVGERRYHHILDPRTGYPADGTRSVTVIAKDALSADAYATAIFVMGPENGMTLVEETPDIEALIVDAKNEIRLSTGLKNRVRVLRAPTQ